MLQERAIATISDLLMHPRFELIPLPGALERIDAIPAGSTVTLTSSPSRGIEPTIEMAGTLAGLGFRAVPHIAARLVRGTDHLDEILARLAWSDIREIFVVGGDSAEPDGPFADAGTLLRAIVERGARFERIGIAGYPEGHPAIADERLWSALLEKQSLATCLVTQMCFDAGAVVRWIAAARERGVRLPVWIGLPGVASRLHLMRIAGKIGVGESARFLNKNLGIISRFMTPGVFNPDELLDDLSPLLGNPALDVRGVHLYTFNQLTETEAWRRQRAGIG